MSTAEVKNDLHRLVVETDDDQMLEQVATFFYALRAAKKKEDWWYSTTEEQKTSIKKGIHEADNGLLIPHDKVRAEINLLLGKKTK
ncbi:MAG: hypothetical protein RLZZ292_813 [Bacteroidota bacterium]|jgi:predicted transcriptional regulator